jgi:hypothetical protein
MHTNSVVFLGIKKMFVNLIFNIIKEGAKSKISAPLK